MFILKDMGFVDVNPALAMFNISSKSVFFNMSPASISPEFQFDGKSSHLKPNEMVNLALDKSTHRFEWIHKDINNISFDAEVFIFAKIREISTLREKRENTLHLKERYELAISGSNEGIWDWNVVTNELYLSSKWKENLGHKDNELENSFDAFASVTHPDDLNMIMQEVEKHFTTQNKGTDLIICMKHENGH